MGVITMDTIALVDRYPHEDERVIAKEIMRAGGGPAAVAAVALARLGISAGIIGTIGDDEDGRQILRIFSDEGVDTQGISTSNQSTAGSVIVASKEHSARAICTRQHPEQIPPSAHAKELISRARWVHVDHVGVKLLKPAGITRGFGPKISFDAGYDIMDFDPRTVDLFVPNDKSLLSRNPQSTLEEALANEFATSQTTIVATRGRHGSVGYSESGFVEAPGFTIDNVSTLGAGDVFHGALIAQIIQGYSLKESMIRANAVAAMSCRGLDGRSAIPTASELNAFLTGAR